jgi:hypothetical protein
MHRAVRPPVCRLALAGLASVLVGSLAGPVRVPAASVGWTTQFGTTSPDEANGVAIDRAGNVFVVGQTSGALPGQKNAGMIDAFLRRYDASGTEVWTRQFGSAERDIPKGVALDDHGNVYVVGQTFGNLPGQPSAGGWDAFLRKYAPGGDEVWTRQFGGGGGESAASVRVDRAGNAYVVGGTRAALPGQRNIGDFDGFIVKLDPTGGTIWERQFGTTVEDYAITVALDGQGNPAVAGETSGRLAGAANGGGLDGFVRQYDTAGDVLWTRQFGSTMDDYAVGSAIGPNGDVFVVGSTTGSLPGHKSEGDADAYIMAFNRKEGAGLWSRQFGTPGVDDAEAIGFDATGNPFVAGRAGGALRGGSAGGGSDAFLAATGPTGDILWVHQFGGPAEDYALALAIGNGGFYLAGGTTGALPGQKNIGHRDAFVVNLW